MPRLDAKEVAAVFSAGFQNFLKESDELPQREGQQRLPEGKWYEGSWTTWHEEPWRMHFFYVPVTNQRVVKPIPKVRGATKRDGGGGLAALAEENGEGVLGKEEGEKEEAEAEAEAEEEPGRYKVWGMTARMLVDAATVAYGEKPEFEHNRHFGDEGMIEALEVMGRLGEKRPQGSVLTDEDLKRARDVSEAGRKSNGGGEGSKM